jgi:hypothetical protein
MLFIDCLVKVIPDLLDQLDIFSFHNWRRFTLLSGSKDWAGKIGEVPAATPQGG